MVKDDGGLAFPALDNSGSGLCLREPGMTLRDYFAGKSLEGVFKLCQNDDLFADETREQLFARRCYEMADAMIAERAK